MKKTKIIVPALGMLLLSTAASVTGTVAWFAMNTEVTATGMKVRAKAEEGLLINEVAAATDPHWDDEATAAQTTATELYPTSTANGTDWFHAASKLENDAAQGNASTDNSNLVSGYEQLSLTSLTGSGIGAAASAGANAQRDVFGKAAADKVGYYVQYTYYIKSSGATNKITLKNEATNQVVRITEVTADGSSVSTDLNKALRVGVKLKNEFYIYNPLGGTSSYYVGTEHTAVTTKASDTITTTDLGELPASTSDGAPVNIFIWYEGEDANCRSTNIKATLDALSVTVKFDLFTVA